MYPISWISFVVLLVSYLRSLLFHFHVAECELMETSNPTPSTCKCINFVKAGVGNCLTPSPAPNHCGMKFCYVAPGSSCLDLERSTIIPGLSYSSQACLVSECEPTASSNPTPNTCKCINFVQGGGGNCLTPSPAPNHCGMKFCYVAPGSSCRDLERSTIIPGLSYSSQACLLR